MTISEEQRSKAWGAIRSNGSGLVIDRGERGSGKTTRAVIWAAGDPDHRAIIVPTMSQAGHVTRLAEEQMRLGRNAIRVVPMSSVLNGSFRGNRFEAWIDEFPTAMDLLGVRIVGISGVA